MISFYHSRLTVRAVRFLYSITCISYFPVVCKNNSQHLFLKLWVPTSLPFSLPTHSHWEGKQFNIGYICVVLQKTSIIIILCKTNYISLHPILPLFLLFSLLILSLPKIAPSTHCPPFHYPPHPAYPLLPTFLYCKISFHTKMSVHFIPSLSQMWWE